MSMKLVFVVPIAFLLVQLTASQNATETDDTDEEMDNFPGPPSFGEGPPGPPPGPPPGGRWRHGHHPFGRGGHCGPPPPFPDANGTETEENSVAKRSIRERREDSEMNSEDTESSGGNGGQGNGPPGGRPPKGGGGRGPPRGFVEKRSIRERRESSQGESEGGMEGDSMGQGQGNGNGRQGGPPQGGGGRGPPRGFVEKRSARLRRESSQTDISSDMYGGMIEQQQENVGKVGPPQGSPPRGFVGAKSTRRRRELSEMNDEDSANDDGNRGQGNGPPPQGGGGGKGGGRGGPRGFVEKRSIRERREVSQAESDGMDEDAMGQGQGNGPPQGGPPQGGPPQGGGGRGPPRGFVKKRSIEVSRDYDPLNGGDMEEMVNGMMGQGMENGNMNDPSYDVDKGPPRTGRMRRCGGRRGRYRSTTTPATTTTTAAARKR